MKIIYTICLTVIFTCAIQAQSFEWGVRLGGPDTDFGISSTIDASGNIYTTGYFEGISDFDPGPATYNLTSAGEKDIFISKLDAAGNFVWAKQFSGTSSGEGLAIKTDAAGNVVVSGTFRSTFDFDPGPGTFNITSYAGGVGISFDLFIAKLDNAGNFVWAKRIGGTSTDKATSLDIDGTGNIYSTGYFQSTADFDPGPGTYNMTAVSTFSSYILKLNTTGNFIWARQFAGSTSSLVTDASQNVFLTGSFQGTIDFDPGAGIYNLTSGGSYDIFIMKLNMSGDFDWVKQMGGTQYDVGASIALDLSGNIYATGSFQGTADFDPGSGTTNLTSGGGSDIYVLKLDNSGNLVWAGVMGGANFNNGTDITTDAQGNVYSTGTFQNTADFDPGPGVYNLMNGASGMAAYVSKLDASGNFVWAAAFLGSTSSNGISINAGANNSLYTTIYFGGTLDFDPGSGVFNITSQGSDVGIMKLSTFTGIADIISHAILIYPNPVNDALTINSEKEIGEIKIYDVVGKLIYSVIVNIQHAEVDVKDLESGIYFIELGNGKFKFVKE